MLPLLAVATMPTGMGVHWQTISVPLDAVRSRKPFRPLSPKPPEEVRSASFFIPFAAK